MAAPSRRPTALHPVKTLTRFRGGSAAWVARVQPVSVGAAARQAPRSLRPCQIADWNAAIPNGPTPWSSDADT